MNYKDTNDWPKISVEKIDRDDIETIFSFQHHDGPITGLISWNNNFYWAKRFDLEDYRYWIIELDEAHGKYLFEYGPSNAVSWRDGKIINHGSVPLEYRKPTLDKLKEPLRDAKVVGYFEHWSY